ncbi:response regulator [Paenibacillus sp. MMO-58]|uniref:response regulator n=1 Tax=Paenibacillus sp. MMO-58 TaxID=3081290 RepID=UPI003018E9CF
MLRLLIAEDEELNREGLVELIDWASIEIEICGIAANGLEALQMLEANRPDLLLTDIRMPIIDGLQLLTTMRERGYETVCVLLSGYNDFANAQRAIRLGVTDFLVKPCSPDEIKRTFIRLTERLYGERRLTDEVKDLEHQLHLHLPIAKSQYLKQWLSSPAMPAENRFEQMRTTQMTIVYQHVLVMVISMDGRAVESLNYNRSDQHLLGIAASNIIQETLENMLLQPVELVAEPRGVAVVFNGIFEWLGDKLRNALSQLQENLFNYLKITVSIGISDTKPDMNQLHAAYEEALEALEQRFFHGPGSSHYYRDVAGTVKVQLPGHINPLDLLHLEQSALEYLRSGLYAEMLNAAEQWLTVFQSDYSHSRKVINNRALSFLGRLIQLLPQADSSTFDWIRDFEQLREQVTRIETLEELAGFIYRTIQQIVATMNPQRTPKRKVQQALELIEVSYADHGMTLAGIAKALFVSSTYLSTLFKQELGVNFLDYVHQYRIEKAKALLQASDMKIHSVAKEVGYYDEAHFTKTFKKWTGMLPSQYKKEMAVIG